MNSYTLRTKLAIAVGSLVVLATSAGYALALPSTIFSDGFESNSLSGWDEHSAQWGTNLVSGVLVHTGDRAAIVRGNTGATPDNLRKNISTVGYTSINFSYWYRVTAGLSGPDYLKAQYSIDGGSNWITLATYADVSVGAWTSESFDLPISASNNPNLEIRFTANFNGPLDAVRIDDMSVSGDAITTNTNAVVVYASDLDNTSASPATVRADGLNKWFEYNDTNDTIDNTLGSFVSGPATAPAGAGSIQFTLGANPLDRKNIATYQFAGTPLNEITSMSFSAYSHSGVAGANESPFLNFNIDFTGSNSWQHRLVYVPSQNGVVPQGTWNTFDAINGGNANWNYSGATWPDTVVGPDAGLTGVAGTTLRTWAAILADYPSASVLASDGWFGVRVGEPGPTNYVGNVDKIVVGTLVGTSLTTTTFDFEPYAVPSCSGSSSFDTFAPGSVDGQGGWASTGSYDQAVVDNAYGYSTFGCKTLRISNAVTSGNFGDQTFSLSVPNEAGETSAENGGYSGGTRKNHFEAQWDFASTDPSGEQSGLNVTVSPDRGDGARMSWIQMADTSTGLQVNFYDYKIGNAVDDGPCGCAPFRYTTIASGLDRAVPHTIKVVMDFIDGPDNDIVKVYVDGVLVHTGTSWEDYFRTEESNPTRTVDSLLFRVSGTSAPSTVGKGFVFDNMDISTSDVPHLGSIHITKYLCPSGTSVNRDDNGTSGAAPIGCVRQEGAHFGYTHGAQTDAGAPYDDFGYPLSVGGSTNSSGELTIPDLDATGRYVVFETNASNVKFGNSDLLGLYCEGDADPTPTHNDNGDITFVTVDGTAQCVAYNVAPQVHVSIVKYISGTMATSGPAYGLSFPMQSSWSTTNIGSGSGNYTLSPSGFATSTPYAAVTSAMNSGASYSTNEVVDNTTVFASDSSVCTEGKFKLLGYRWGNTISEAEGMSLSTSTPSFTNLLMDKFVIVDNAPCPPPADTTAPATTTITAPFEGQAFNTTPILDTWTPVATDINGDPEASGIAKYQIAYVYDDGHTFGGSTCPSVTMLGGHTVGGCRDVTSGTSRNHTPSLSEQGGVTIYVRAVDGSNNIGDWSNPVRYIYDTTSSGGGDTMAHLILVKHTTDASENEFIFNVTGTSYSNVVGLATDNSGMATSTTMDLTPGTFDASETVPTGWLLNSVSCLDNGSTAGTSITDGKELAIGAGHTVTCTFTNEPASTETVHVHQGDLATSTGDVTANPGKWFFYNDETDVIDNSLGGFISGPATPFIGMGSAQISVSGTQRRNLSTYGFAGTPLSEISKMSFSTYNPSAGNDGSATRSAYLNFNVDFDGTNAWQKRIAFVPRQNGSVTQDSWQEWDAINGGNAMYSYSGTTWPGTAISGATLRSWNDIISSYPSARVLPSDGWLGMRVGEPYTDGYTENIDTFSMTVNNGSHATTTIFDFEPDVGTDTTITNAASLASGTSVVGVPFTVQWSVTPSSGSSSPTGTVQIKVNGSASGGCSAAASVGSCDITPSTTGSITLQAFFSGDAGFDDSSSAIATHEIVAAPTVSSFASTSGGGGNGPIVGSGGIGFFGSVLGASTSNVGNGGGEVLGASTSGPACESAALLTKYMRQGKTNDPVEVKKLQAFLNAEMSAGLPVSGFFGPLTETSVKAFQTKYSADILAPWGLTQPTGYVYKLTLWKINGITCANLNAPKPSVTQ